MKMSLVLASEDFKIFDVSGIKVEKRLSFEKEAKNLVPRNEDEAFIKEFIRERGYAKIGAEKIISWSSAAEWNEILWNIDWMHRGGWIKDEILKGKETLPDIVEPDPDEDQVEGNESYFKGFYPLERYIEKTVYDTDNQDEAWELPSISAKEKNLSGRIKKLDEFAAIYEDFSKMNGLWVAPIEGLSISMSCDAKIDHIKDENKDSQSIESVNVSMKHSTKGVMEEGSVTLYNTAKTTYTDPNGDERTYSFSDNCIWRKTHNKVEIKNGRDSEGNLQYKEADRKSEVKMDFVIDATDQKYTTEEGQELEWDLKAAIWFVEIHVRYHNFETEEGEEFRHQFIVKADLDGKKIIAGDSIRKKLEEKIPKGNGVMTRMEMNLRTFGWMADIKWNMRINKAETANGTN